MSVTFSIEAHLRLLPIGHARFYILIFWHKSKVFVDVNGPLSSVKLYNKFY